MRFEGADSHCEACRLGRGNLKNERQRDCFAALAMTPSAFSNLNWYYIDCVKYMRF